MKIFRLEPESCNYIDNDGCVLLAENEEEALKLAEDNNIFEASQGKITIEEIDINEKQKWTKIRNELL